MPKALDDLVTKLMADTTFCPDKTEDERKSIADAIANKQLTGSILDPIIFTANDPEAPVYSMVSASDGSASMLLFKNAVLARAEINKNRDQIDEQGIEELASSIPGWPIDIEHARRQICGMFTAGRASTDKQRALVDGAIWADRYPETAQGVMAGTDYLSILAKAAKATCSICGIEFASAKLYCEHLQDRPKHGAVRKLSGLAARGGAITKSPAGTDTAFDPNHIYIVASHEEIVEPTPELTASWYDKYLKSGETINDLPASDFADPEGRRFPYKIHGVVKDEGWHAAWSAAHGGHTGVADESAIAKLKRDKPAGVPIKESTMDEKDIQKLKEDLAAALARITEMEAAHKTALDDAKVKIEAAQAKIVELDAKVAEAAQKELALVASARRQKLGAAITDAEWAAQKDALTALPEAAFDLVASKMVVPVKSGSGGADSSLLVTADPGSNGAKLSLR